MIDPTILAAYVAEVRQQRLDAKKAELETIAERQRFEQSVLRLPSKRRIKLGLVP